MPPTPASYDGCALRINHWFRWIEPRQRSEFLDEHLGFHQRQCGIKRIREDLRMRFKEAQLTIRIAIVDFGCHAMQRETDLPQVPSRLPAFDAAGEVFCSDL